VSEPIEPKIDLKEMFAKKVKKDVKMGEKGK
jgi:hypothetical protein